MLREKDLSKANCKLICQINTLKITKKVIQFNDFGIGILFSVFQGLCVGNVTTFNQNTVKALQNINLISGMV